MKTTKQNNLPGAGGKFRRALLTASLVALLAAGCATRSRNRVSQPTSLRYSITNLIGDPFHPEFSLTPMRHRAGCLQQAKQMFARLLTSVLVMASASSRDAEASGEQTDSLHDLPVASTPAGALCTKSDLLQNPSPKQRTKRTSQTTSILAAVAYGNGTFVVGGANGFMLTSPNAVTWTVRSSGTSNPFLGATYGNGIFVAVTAALVGGEIVNGPIFTSPTGVVRTSYPAGWGLLTGMVYLSP